MRVVEVLAAAEAVRVFAEMIERHWHPMWIAAYCVQGREWSSALGHVEGTLDHQDPRHPAAMQKTDSHEEVSAAENFDLHHCAPAVKPLKS